MDIRCIAFEHLAALILQKMQEGYHPVYRGYYLYFEK